MSCCLLGSVLLSSVRNLLFFVFGDSLYFDQFMHKRTYVHARRNYGPFFWWLSTVTCVFARESSRTHERDRVDSTVVAGSEVLIALHVRNSWILKFPSCRVLAVFKDGCRGLCRASGSTGAVEIAHSHLGVAVIAGDWTRSIRGLASGPHRVIAN